MAMTRVDRHDWTTVPPLCGHLTTDETALTEAASDLGNLAYVTPGAILSPGEDSDVSAMLEWCARYQVPWRARGTHHTMHGQGLPERGGLQIDMRSLNQVRSVSRHGGVIADAGATVRDVVTAAAEHGLRLTAGPTGYTRLTLGGVCSAGGISTRPDSGALIDSVRAAHVITPDGQSAWCTRDEHSELFHAVLGGFGTAGVLTKVVLDVTDAPARVRTWELTYGPDTLDDMLHDLRTIARRGLADEAFVMWHKPDMRTYRLMVSVYHDEENPPHAHEILRGLSRPAPFDHEHQDTDLVSHLLAIDSLYDEATDNGWERSTKIWTDAFLPDQGVDRFVTTVLPTLTERDFSATSFGLIFAKTRRKFGTGQMELPAPSRPDDELELVFLVDLLKDNHGIDDDPHWVPDMIARHHEHLAVARSCGATIYRIGTTP